MTDRHEVTMHDADGALVAAALIGGTDADATLVDIRVGPGHLPVGARAALVDTVLDQPELVPGSALRATTPAGDGEIIGRLIDRTDDPTTRRAGSTCIVEATMPADDSAPQSPS